IWAFNRRDCKRDVDVPAVFSHAHGFVVFHALAGSQTRQNGGLFVLVTWGDQDSDWFADYLIGGVPEDAFRTLVPTCDDAFERLADNRVIGRLDQRDRKDV